MIVKINVLKSVYIICLVIWIVKASVPEKLSIFTLRLKRSVYFFVIKKFVFKTDIL